MKVKLRDFGDIDATRSAVYAGIKNGFEKRFPMEGKFVKLNIKDVQIKDKIMTREDAKHAKLYDLDLAVPVTGNVELVDKATDKVIQSRKMVLGHMPYLVPKMGVLIGNGTDFSVSNQMRLLPGAYTRERLDGDIETQFNTQGRMGFRVSMDPQTATFRLNVGSNKLPLYPILKATGVSDKELEKVWGSDILERNTTHRTEAVDRFYNKLAGKRALPNLTPEEQGREISTQLENLKLLPEVTQKTLGSPFTHASPTAMVAASKRILGVFSGKEKPDDRDSLEFKSFHGLEDFIQEKIEKDSGSIARKLMFKLDKSKDLSKMPSSYFNNYFKSIVRGDERAQPLAEVNPIQIYDNMYQNTILGEGGVGSIDMITMAARNVHPSQFGFLDPVRGPESDKIGIDTRFAYNTFKGDDKKIYSEFINAKTGKKEFLTPSEAMKFRIGFPSEQKKKGSLYAIHEGEIKNVDKKDVDYYIGSINDNFSLYSNMVPMVTAIQGNRLLMAGKALSDTLPLVNKVAPLVRSKKDDEPGMDFETFYGRKVLSELSPTDGEVVSVKPSAIEIKAKDGTKHTVEMFDNYPLSLKTMFKETTNVKAGDKVKKNQVIATSNFTDDKGILSAGTHLLSMYAPYEGMTYEDGVVLSESAANKKLLSEQLYTYEVPLDDNTIISKKNFTGYFPTLFRKHQADKVDANGLPKVGTLVYKDDPLIMAIKQKELTSTDMALGKLHKALKNKYSDASATWDHGSPGEVVYSIMTPKKAKVYVKSRTPMQIGDKLTGRYGNKGIVSLIVPDSEMPKMERTGEALDAIFNVTGIVSRINPAQVTEGLLSRIAKEKGTIYQMGAETDGSYIDFAMKELKKNGMESEENVVDPKYGKLKTMITYPYVLKLSKMSDSIRSARGMSSYTSDMQPVKGKMDGGTSSVVYSSSLTPMATKKSEGSAVKIGADVAVALLAHGAINNLRDTTLVKGQKNDEFWRALTLGYPLPTPDVPFVYKKFEKMLTASGAHVERKGDTIRITPLTDTEINKVSSGAIKNAKFINASNMEPYAGGLFDFGLTGGPAGEKWSHMDLTEPMPNPIMEDSLRNILGVTQADYSKIIAGDMEIGGEAGPMGIKNALAKLDVEAEIKKIEADLPFAKKTHKDKMLKKLRALIGIRRSGKKAEDLILTKFPIIPPMFRPVVMLAEKGTATVSDANKLYRDMFYANDSLKSLSGLSKKDTAEERLNLYNSLKAVAGIDDPISVKNQQSDVKGFIKKITGNQPKNGFFFDKMVSKTQDLVGRGVAILDSTLDMDQIRIPEENLWTQLKPFIIKELVTKRGFKALLAEEMVETKQPVARDAMMTVLKERPILMNRAPSLHRFSIMAFNAIPGKDKAIGTSPYITGPFGLDYDGDQVQTFVPVTDAAVREARDTLMPSQNLFSPKDNKIHYKPPHEDVLGVFLATNKADKNKPIKFKNVEEVRKALRAGTVDYSTQITIEEGFWSTTLD